MHTSPLDALTQIATHVPVWVWILLVALIALGLKQRQTQFVSRKRLLVLPAVWLVFGAWGVQKGFGQAGTAGVAMVAWAAGLLTSTGALVASGWPASTDSRTGQPQAPGAIDATGAQRASGLYRVPGSWLPMVVMLAIFCARFAVGMALGVRPSLAQDATFAGIASLSFGLLSGFFVGRSLNILRRGGWERPVQAAMAA
ncbi:DUF6622 family protein [Roseateles terrae]|uniref:DUF1453 domain-containing protein n=1 Tax=Roseateles terrae TaxID=431060 RepID=A0ABR6GPQ7_9BURK|nr:DUF6622 family protein [Roseateles terrae]MBB3194077.1 hypothetical protein [Roseateles terrae]OWQ87941.1 hypothetical protein CDN98_07245 [Roseateles terrae]